MAQNIILICVIILILQCSPSHCFFFVIPEDVAMGITTYFGFVPRIFKDVRSAPRREARRPFIELLLRTGILKRVSHHRDIDNDIEAR